MAFNSPQNRRFESARIVAIYTIVGALWIYGSDSLLGWMVHEPDIMTRIAVMKGIFFIVLTATLLYFLINRYAKRIIAAEKSRIESLKNYRVIFDATNEAIFVHDAESGRIMDVNVRMPEMFGCEYDEVLGSDIGRFSGGTPPYTLAEAIEMMRRATTEGPQVFEWRCRRKNGELFWCEVSLKRVTMQGKDRVLAVVRDLTEQKRAEEERRQMELRLLHAQKMESLGVLAGGIAHDFNNVLTAIIGNISCARQRPDNSVELEQFLKGAERAAMRATEIARRILTFAKGGEPITSPASVKSLLEESLSLMLSGARVSREIQIPDGLPPVLVDAGQISQVFNNIILNAVQAMPDGGNIAVSAEPCEIGESSHVALEPGSYVRVRIADQGVGMSPETVKLIFDPYFTTKSTGSGLGLTSSYSIVTRHGGSIDVSSKLDKGTTFEILLPVARGKTPAESNQQETVAASQPVSSRILVMDDEEMIRETLCGMLSSLGYKPFSCRDGEEALGLYGAALESGEPFQLAILDLTIAGGLGGMETARRIREKDPLACLIVSSGYSSDPVLADPAAYGFMGTLQKPFSLGELRKVLDGIVR